MRIDKFCPLTFSAATLKIQITSVIVSTTQKIKIINAIFDYAIRPTLANDGGDLELVGIKGTVIQIHYQGACGTCPSSTRGTLQYIEGMIKENLHRDLTVEAL